MCRNGFSRKPLNLHWSFYKWESSTSLLHHISFHNPIRGVWVKWPVAVLITLAALLHLWPAFIKWATCLFLDVIKVCRWGGEQSIIMFSRNVDTYSIIIITTCSVCCIVVKCYVTHLPAHWSVCPCKRCCFQAFEFKTNNRLLNRFQSLCQLETQRHFIWMLTVLRH